MNRWKATMPLSSLNAWVLENAAFMSKSDLLRLSAKCEAALPIAVQLLHPFMDDRERVNFYDFSSWWNSPQAFWWRRSSQSVMVNLLRDFQLHAGSRALPK